jgi:uncharacterized membrane protein
MGLLIVCALLFLFLYPVIVSNIKVGSVKNNAQDAVARVAALEKALALMRERVDALERQAAPAPVAEPASAAIPVLTTTIPVPSPAPTFKPIPRRPAPAPVAPTAAPRPPAPPALAPAWLLAIKKWLFTGNLVAKFGLLILIIGIGFLVNYTAQRVTLPIELRLAGVVVADIALLLWGWRIRTTRRDVALPVQGAALAIMMVVVFGAFQRLHLIPAAFAFPLLVALTAFTCVLALLQDAFWLAVFGIIGGFAAPLLVSTGSGNHVALFSYYALLNAGILALALRRSWRALNALGFTATFLIGGAWGLMRYTPDNYASAQAFLILFFLFYVGIALAWARRRAPQFDDAVDASLVFGTPAAAFAMQYGMVKDMPFGIAFSALALGLFYIGLAGVLLRRAGRGTAQFGLLTATFVALATIFGTLALPFALSGSWTSAAWALEGAGLVWVGLRQRHVRAWSFGLLVQCGAWISFLHAMGADTASTATQTMLWVGCLLLLGAVTALAISVRHPPPRANRQTVILHLIAAVVLVPTAWGGATASLAPMLLDAALLAAAAGVTSWLFRPGDSGRHTASQCLLVWAGAWWYGPALWAGAAGIAQLVLPGSAIELDPYLATPGSLQVAVYIVLVCASALAALTSARRLAWPALRWLGLAGWAALALASLALLDRLYSFGAWPTPPQVVAWALAWVCGDILLWRWQAEGWPMAPLWRKVLHLLRTGAPWLMLWPLFSRLIADWLAVAPEQQDLLTFAGWRVSGSWSHFIPAWLMLLGVFWIAARSRAERWPVAPIAHWYRRRIVPAAACWFMLLALFWNLQQNGAMAPLPYLPLLNPLDLSTAFALLLWLASYRLWREGEAPGAALPPIVALMPRIAGFAAWGWLNMVLLRTAAHFLDIDYTLDALGASTFIQAMLSLAWSVSALVVMRRARSVTLRLSGPEAARKLWMLGAVLLGVVVAKLFLIDLSNTGSIARIVSFVGVGLLMVLIGYLAPYPSPASGIEPVREGAGSGA